MDSLRMICTENPNYELVINTALCSKDRFTANKLDNNSWWYLHGELEERCHYDKATIYNLDEFPQYLKKTLYWNEICGDISRMPTLKWYKQMYCTTIIPVNVYGIDEPCTGFFWTSKPQIITNINSNGETKFEMWDQRGLVCLNSDKFAIKDAMKKYSERSPIL